MTEVLQKEYYDDGRPPKSIHVKTERNWVPALPAVIAKRQPELTAVEGEIVGRGQMMPAMMAKEAHTSHIRQTDDAITQSQASLLYSTAYIKIFGIVTGALLAIIYVAHGGDLWVYFFAGLLSWGVAGLIILAVNRWQGLHHSSIGVAHAQIAATERVAIYAIDRHCTMLERKWGIDADRTEITVSRD